MLHDKRPICRTKAALPGSNLNITFDHRLKRYYIRQSTTKPFFTPALSGFGRWL
jgi:hypothetical protein